MRLHHIALWVEDLEALREFYCLWFGAQCGEKYVNSTKGFESYMLSFPGGGRLELMRKGGLGRRETAETFGCAHFALSLESEHQVNEYAERLKAHGIRILDGPRWTGDGCYECAVEDPEGNRVELTV